MRIGVLGSGMVGQAIGSKLVHLGHEVMMGSRDVANAKGVVWAKEEGGQHALFGSYANAAEFGEIIFNCTLGTASMAALRMAGASNLKGKILIDPANPRPLIESTFVFVIGKSVNANKTVINILPY